MAKPRPIVGLLSGIAAGLAASAAMHLFQKLAERAPQGEDAALPAMPSKANDAIPYAVGAALGGMYGLLSEYQPDAGTGFGTAYGVATAALIDKVAPAPTSDAPAHGAVSHLVFGAVLEGVRTLIAGRR